MASEIDDDLSPAAESTKTTTRKKKNEKSFSEGDGTQKSMRKKNKGNGDSRTSSNGDKSKPSKKDGSAGMRASVTSRLSSADDDSGSEKTRKETKTSKRKSKKTRINMDGSISYLSEGLQQQQQQQQQETVPIDDSKRMPRAEKHKRILKEADQARLVVEKKVQKRRDKYRKGPPQRTFSKEFLDLASKQQIESLYGSLKSSPQRAGGGVGGRNDSSFYDPSAHIDGEGHSSFPVNNTTRALSDPCFDSDDEHEVLIGGTNSVAQDSKPMVALDDALDTNTRPSASLQGGSGTFDSHGGMQTPRRAKGRLRDYDVTTIHHDVRQKNTAVLSESEIDPDQASDKNNNMDSAKNRVTSSASNDRQRKRNKKQKPPKRKSIDAEEDRSKKSDISDIEEMDKGKSNTRVSWVLSAISYDDDDLQPKHTPTPKKKPLSILQFKKTSNTTSPKNGISTPPLGEERAPSRPQKEQLPKLRWCVNGDVETAAFQHAKIRCGRDSVTSLPEQSPQVVTASLTEKPNKHIIGGRILQWQFWLIILVLVLVCGGLAIFLLFRLGVIDSNESVDMAASAPTISPTQVLSQQPTSPSFILVAEAVLEQFGEDAFIRLRDLNSPQASAAQWIADIDESASFPFSDEDSSMRFCQRYALAAVYFSTGGNDSWLNDFNFLSDSHECTWNDSGDDNGVICKDGQLVTGIKMPSNNLIGLIPPEMAGLSTLQFLVLDNNGITGTLPEAVFRLTKLQELSLGNNMLSGGISTSIGQLSNLKTLSINKSRMTGSLPTEIGNLSLLQTLILAKSSFQGEIPQSIRSLVNLIILDLGDNLLDSTIPVRIAGLSSLKKLDLSLNKLTGRLLSGGFPSLESFDVHSNRLTGTISSLFPNLRMLNLRSNRFTGPLPTNWLASPAITMIDVSENGLTGSIPAVMGSLFELSFFYASDCELAGTLPVGLGNTVIEELDVEGNTLSGPVPETFVQLPLGKLS